MSNFSELRDIIGDKLAIKVVAKLGGKIVRVRNRLTNAKVMYAKDKKRFKGMTFKAVARELKCSWQYARKLCYMFHKLQQKKLDLKK